MDPLTRAPAPASPLRIVIVDLQRFDVDFLGSIELQFAAGDLQRRGHDVALLRMVVGLSGERLEPAHRRRLLAFIDAHQTEVVVTRLHIDADWVEALAARPLRLVFLNAAGRPAHHHPAYIEVPARARDALIDVVEGRPRPDAADPQGLLTAYTDEARFWPETTYHDPLTGSRHPYPMHTLITHTGCPYAASAARHPAFQGVTFDDQIHTTGCTFCFSGGNYRPLDVKDYIGFLADQIAWYTTHNPDAELVFPDETAAERLIQLIPRLGARGIRPKRLLFKMRLNGLYPLRNRFAQALATARQHDIRVCCYLMGVENFSPAELSRFNKGITAEQIVEVIEQLNQLAARFPEHFDHRRYPSHGFILHTPWTTLGDLATNLSYFRRLDLVTLCGKAPYSRLRLSRWQPLYALARRDGLLDDTDRFSRIVRRQLGYHEADLPWRFADPAVELHYYLITRSKERLQAEGQALFALLEQTVAFVTAARPQEPLREAALEDALSRFLRRCTVRNVVLKPKRRVHLSAQRAQQATARLVARSPRLAWQLVETAALEEGTQLRFEHRRGEELSVLATLGAVEEKTLRVRILSLNPSRSARIFVRAFALALR